MSGNERSLASSAGMNTQGSSGGSGPSPATTGGTNQSDEQTEPASTLGIFALDYKK
jgi:hypothetical protein